jgi:tetraprenyl-beta-curcumene synthase
MSSTSANAASAAIETALPGERTDTRRATPGSPSRVFSGGDRGLAARASLALVVANVRYWSTIAPVVRGELARWRTRAQAICDPELRALALSKLDRESFNAEAGAMLATLAPRAHRREVVQAIVALQVLFDLLDGLTEQPLADPLADGERLFTPFTDALRRGAESAAAPDGAQDGYLWELSEAASSAVAALPAREAVVEAASASAQRAAEAQIRMHAVPQLGVEQLREWAQTQARGTDLQWRELAAGAASSVLAVHALIAAAAEATSTHAQAARIADAYLSICVLLTLLDSLIDQERDARAGEAGYISLYEDRSLLAEMLPAAARRAGAQARELPHGTQHVMMLTGVVASSTSAPDAGSEPARAVVARLHAALVPLIAPTLVLMRAWRLARRLRGGTV